LSSLSVSQPVHLDFIDKASDYTKILEVACPRVVAKRALCPIFLEEREQKAFSSIPRPEGWSYWK
jgi:hypothetical protein